MEYEKISWREILYRALYVNKSYDKKSIAVKDILSVQQQMQETIAEFNKYAVTTGVMFYLSKPYTQKELVNHISKIKWLKYNRGRFMIDFDYSDSINLFPNVAPKNKNDIKNYAKSTKNKFMYSLIVGVKHTNNEKQM